MTSSRMIITLDRLEELSPLLYIVRDSAFGLGENETLETWVDMKFTSGLALRFLLSANINSSGTVTFGFTLGKLEVISRDLHQFNEQIALRIAAVQAVHDAELIRRRTSAPTGEEDYAT